jgi:hypothetical protein
LAGMIALGLWLGPKLAIGKTRTENTIATVTHTSRSGDRMLIEYRFDYRGQTYPDGEAYCSNCGYFYDEARTKGEVTVWFDPENPTDSHWRKPTRGLNFFLKTLYWGIIVLIVGGYASYLLSIGIFKGTTKATATAPKFGPGFTYVYVVIARALIPIDRDATDVFGPFDDPLTEAQMTTLSTLPYVVETYQMELQVNPPKTEYLETPKEIVAILERKFKEPWEQHISE